MCFCGRHLFRRMPTASSSAVRILRLCVRLAGVQDHQQQVRALAHSNDLAPAPCTHQQ